MTKFIPKLQEISTKFSGSESKPEQTSGRETEIQQTTAPQEVTKEASPITPETPQEPLEPNQLNSLEELGSFSAAAEAEIAAAQEIAAQNQETASTNFLSTVKQTTREIATKLHIPQSVLDSPWLDPHNPLYRTKKFWITTGAAVTLGGGALATGITWWTLERNLPSPNDVVTFVRDGTLTIKAEDGTILQQIGPATREKLPLEQMPPQLVQAFIASEDRRFYQHHGVDWQGVGRAFVSNIGAGNVVEGGSTITQQLARIVFLNQERSISRKVQEVMLAQKIEKEMKKDKILERYLNLVYLGEGAYGVADAAWVYFSKPTSDLSLPEIATIVGVTPAPSTFSPIANPKLALERRNIVLNRMVDAGFITKDQAQAASAEPLALQPAAPKRLSTEAAYFTSYIQQELPKYVPQDAIEAGGLTVETSLNPKWQKIAEEVVDEVVSENGKQQGFQQAALVSIDPRNGEVKAMVGGTDFDNTQFNRVTQAQRQPGSTFKGFLYTTAIAGGISPYRGYLDAPFQVDDYTPKNYNDDYRGWISMRDALTSSINTIAVKVLLNTGFQPVIDTAHKMGIKSELKPTYSLALGASEVNLLELTNAYGTFAAKGMQAPVYGIRRVIDQQGKVIFEAKPQPQQALDAETSAIMTWMLEDVVNDGTGRPAQLFDRQVAGKTGTSDQARDLWFVGYIPQLVTGVWLGNDDNSPTWGTSATAARTWNKFMVKAVEDISIEKFPERPKLEGRKGILALQPIKPNKMSNIRDTAAKTEDSDTERPRSSRRQVSVSSTSNTPTVSSPRRRYSQNTAVTSDSSNTQAAYRPRRRRISQSNDDTSNTTNTQTTSRSRRRYYRSNSDTSSSTDTQTTSRPRRRYSQNTAVTSNSSSTQTNYRSRRRSYQSNTSSSETQQPVVRSRRSNVQQNSSSQTSQPRRSRRIYNSSSNSSSSRTRSRAQSQTTRQAAPAPAPAAPSPSFELNSHN
ncbi:PBP1A family penicillin-binding protein [[Phormidium] sp. LEGE 05292]|uniref:transglycosylase domain-containing protein n=1 Tax=[Phormidium] sp. LEGE 05292 TaxID=767427 RepID=UPI002AD3AEA8|nr:PBP1A family penicillin-binding protein [Phormidium sp. LEGE 05292]